MLKDLNMLKDLKKNMYVRRILKQPKAFSRDKNTVLFRFYIKICGCIAKFFYCSQKIYYV